MKIYLRVERRIYDFETGQKVEDLTKVKGYIIEFTDLQPHTRKPKKVSSFQYVYRAKDKKAYIVSPSLASTFLRDVLFDYTGKNRVVITGKGIILAFFGEHQEYLLSTDEEERQKFLEKLYQGLDYEEIPVEQVIKLVSKDYKPLIAGLSVALVVLIGAVFLFNSSDEEVDLSKYQIKQNQQPVVVNPEKQAVMETVAFIDNLSNLNISPWGFVKEINFSGKEITLGSLLPAEGYKKNGEYYEKTVKFSGGIKEPDKDVKECFEYLKNNEIEFVSNKYVEFRIDKSMTVKDLEKFLKQIDGCPVNIQGSTRYENILKRHLNANVKLYLNI